MRWHDLTRACLTWGPWLVLLSTLTLIALALIVTIVIDDRTRPHSH